MAMLHLVRWDGHCVLSDCNAELSVKDLFVVRDGEEEWQCPECEAVFKVYTMGHNELVEKRH